MGDDVVHGTPGTYVLAPPDVVHWFRNVSDEPVRMLNLHTPGSFAQYRRELQELRAQGTEPDAAFFERHDVFDDLEASGENGLAGTSDAGRAKYGDQAPMAAVCCNACHVHDDEPPRAGDGHGARCSTPSGASASSLGR